MESSFFTNVLELNIEMYKEIVRSVNLYNQKLTSKKEVFNDIYKYIEKYMNENNEKIKVNIVIEMMRYIDEYKSSIMSFHDWYFSMLYNQIEEYNNQNPNNKYLPDNVIMTYIEFTTSITKLINNSIAMKIYNFFTDNLKKTILIFDLFINNIFTKFKLDEDNKSIHGGQKYIPEMHTDKFNEEENEITEIKEKFDILEKKGKENHTLKNNNVKRNMTMKTTNNKK
jgi:hypothetical protein